MHAILNSHGVPTMSLRPRAQRPLKSLAAWPQAGLLLCLCLCVSQPAWAWGSLLLMDAPPERDHWAAGASAWSVPRASGSNRQTALLLPAIDYAGANGLFASTDVGLGQNLSPWSSVQAGWRLWPQFGRPRQDASTALPAFGPRLLKQGFANAQLTEWLLAQSTLSVGGGRLRQGVSAEFGLTSGIPLGQELLGVGVSATQGNRAFRRDETGEARSGWSDCAWTLGMEHRWSQAWRVDAQFQQAWLLGDKSALRERGVQRRQHLLTVGLWRDF